MKSSKSSKELLEASLLSNDRNQEFQGVLWIDFAPQKLWSESPKKLCGASLPIDEGKQVFKSTNVSKSKSRKEL